MPLVESNTNAVVVEPDEDSNSSSMPDEIVCQDASVIEMANELLALSGKQGPTMMTTQVRPLFRPPTYTPSSKTAFSSSRKKRAYSAAISDDEEDVLQKMTQVPPSNKKFATFFGGSPTQHIPLGRPLAAPPRLPCLAPGQAVVVPMPLLSKKASSKALL